MRAEFLSAYSSGSNEWDAAAGLETSCWDGTYTYTQCCNNGGATPDGTGDTSCWFSDITYANCLCEDPCGSLSCGVHGVCDAASSSCVCLIGYSGSSCENWVGHQLKNGVEARQDLDSSYYTCDFIHVHVL